MESEESKCIVVWRHILKESYRKGNIYDDICNRCCFHSKKVVRLLNRTMEKNTQMIGTI